jgi:hypothetical protein
MSMVIHLRSTIAHTALYTVKRVGIAHAINHVRGEDKMLKGYKTILFAMASATFLYLEMSDLTEIIAPEFQKYSVIIIGLINIYLRIITDSRVGKKG